MVSMDRVVLFLLKGRGIGFVFRWLVRNVVLLLFFLWLFCFLGLRLLGLILGLVRTFSSFKFSRWVWFGLVWFG